MLRAASIFTCLLISAACFAQTDRKEVRKGNREFRKSQWQNAEIDYKKGLLKDSTSVAGRYNLANNYYRMENFAEAGKLFESLRDTMTAPSAKPKQAASYFHNQGNNFLKQKDWGHAVDAYKDALRRNPTDMETKSNLAYALKMLENQQKNGGGGQNNQQNQDQNKDKDKDQNKQNQNNQNNQNQDNRNQDQNKDQNHQNQNNQGNQNQNQQPQGGQGQQKISPQDAQRMLQAIDAQEKNTQDKVKKEKALLMKSRQKEKNW